MILYAIPPIIVGMLGYMFLVAGYKMPRDL